jgi:hypothetical protein
LLFAPAERVLEIVDPRYKKFFDNLSKDESDLPFKNEKFEEFHRKIREAIARRYESEAKGVSDIREGKYKIRSL